MLTAANIYKSYHGSGTVLNNISISLKEGEIHSIVGESGSGKTTLLNIIAGLSEVDKGSIFLGEEEMLHPSGQLIAGHPKIKLVSQDFKLFPNLSLRQNISYPVRFYNKEYITFRIEYLIGLFGLKSIENHLPKDVSGGEKQRASIAQSIADEPLVLLLDEPFSQLDTENKLILKREIVQLVKNEKISCAFVTHDINDAFSVSNHISIIKNGTIIQSASPQEIYFSPVNEYAAKLSGLCSIVENIFLMNLTIMANYY